MPSIAVRPHGPSEPDSPRKQPAEKGFRTNGDRPTVLVVDDDRANLALARTLLEEEGFAVEVAADAIGALEVLKTCDPALILMDIQLPGMDGWELAWRLKRNPATTHIPVVALTAYGTKGDEQRARKAGCVAFIAKPVSTRTLPSIVRQYLLRTRT